MSKGSTVKLSEQWLRRGLSGKGVGRTSRNSGSSHSVKVESIVNGAACVSERSGISIRVIVQ